MTEHVFTLAQMRDAIRQVEQGGHSVFAPSSSEMWLGCAGSLIPNLFAPDDAGEDAAYGTVGHHVGETWLRTGKKPTHLLGTKKFVDADCLGFVIEIDDEMMDHVERYVRYCRSLPGTHYVETRVDISRLTPIPNQRGTADHAACSWQTLIITDLKLGIRHKVFAKDNTQARLYALGFFYEWDWLYNFQTIVIRIAQPRIDHFDEWTITREELLEFAAYVKPRAKAAWVQNAPRTPSEKACQWCRVKGTCGPRIKQSVDVMEGVFGSMGREINADEVMEFKEKLHSGEWEFSPISPLELSTEDLEKLHALGSVVKKTWDQIATELFKRAVGGMVLTEFKLAEGRSYRAFRKPKLAAQKLIDLGCDPEDVMKTVLPSPAEAEELLKKQGYKGEALEAALDGLGIFKPPGKAALVPMHDNRPAINRDYDVFGD